MKKKHYTQPSSFVVRLHLSDNTNQTIPIFGEGSQGGGPGIADVKGIDFEDEEDNDESMDVWEDLHFHRIFSEEAEEQ